MELFTKKKPVPRVVDVVRQRELQESAARTTCRKLIVTPNLIKRLGLEKDLVGHDGCVNCLEWNESGTLLASASDDMQVILWDPYTYKIKYSIETGHGGNIFTVKFMPQSNDSVIVTGAGDYKIRVHNLAAKCPGDMMLVCNCHFGRVKRVATAPGVPYLFWSASEDGLIMQFDLRSPHSCKTNDRKTVLVNLSNHTGRFVEAKCIDVNPRRPELIAVGANDAYVRMYDRRMIKLSNRPDSVAAISNSPNLGNGDPDNNIPLGCAQYFIAGHLRNRDNCKRYCTTYVTFNDDGNELLVNMGAEQIYLFDINNHANSRNFIVPIELVTNVGDQDDEPFRENNSTAYVLEDLSSMNATEFSPAVEDLQKKAKKAFEEERYANAVALYNEAIDLCPKSAVLYGNRAGTYMKRAWDGDIYAALRDCRVTLALDPEHVKAHFRLARCLFDLSRIQDADTVMKNFQEKFPELAGNSAFRALKKDIKEALNSSASHQPNETKISDYEKEWRKSAIDFKLRFCGHCNTITDIKEANFFGGEGQYIIAGSDDGSFFIWDRYTTNIARVMKGDQRIVNCLQPHPSTCLIATSGIEPVIKLWSPIPEDGSVNTWVIENPNEAATANYIRMNTDHFEVMFWNMGYRVPGQNAGAGQDDDDDDDEDRQYSSNTQPLNCRPS